MIRAGSLNRLVSIRSMAVTTRSTDGQPIYGTSTVLKSVWADRQPISGREMFQAEQRWSDITVRWILRYISTVTILPEHKVVDLMDSSAEYDIKAVINIDDRDQGWELLTSKVT